MQPLVPTFAGLVLLTTGLSALGFAFAAIFDGNVGEEMMISNATCDTLSNSSCADTHELLKITPLDDMTQEYANVYYGFNGAAMLLALITALPILMNGKVSMPRTKFVFTMLAIIFYIVAIGFGAMLNYEVYDHTQNFETKGESLYFLTWFTAALGVMSNVGLLCFLYMKMRMPSELPTVPVPAPVSDAASYARNVIKHPPKSRASMRAV